MEGRGERVTSRRGDQPEEAVGGGRLCGPGENGWWLHLGRLWGWRSRWDVSVRYIRGGLRDRLDVAEEREGIYRNDASCPVTIAS